MDQQQLTFRGSGSRCKVCIRTVHEQQRGQIEWEHKLYQRSTLMQSRMHRVFRYKFPTANLWRCRTTSRSSLELLGAVPSNLLGKDAFVKESQASALYSYPNQSRTGRDAEGAGATASLIDGSKHQLTSTPLYNATAPEVCRHCYATWIIDDRLLSS